MTRSRCDVVHDSSLLAWLIVAIDRQARGRSSRPVEAAVVLTNLVSGTPLALRRLQEHRHDAIALSAPLVVAVAVLTTFRPSPRWAAVAATGTLALMNVSEHRRAQRLAVSGQ